MLTEMSFFRALVYQIHCGQAYFELSISSLSQRGRVGVGVQKCRLCPFAV
jgi:DNA-binding transcriptional regulator of glucitol operon